MFKNSSKLSKNSGSETSILTTPLLVRGAVDAIVGTLGTNDVLLKEEKRKDKKNYANSRRIETRTYAS